MWHPNSPSPSTGFDCNSKCKYFGWMTYSHSSLQSGIWLCWDCLTQLVRALHCLFSVLRQNPTTSIGNFGTLGVPSLPLYLPFPTMERVLMPFSSLNATIQLAAECLGQHSPWCLFGFASNHRCWECKPCTLLRWLRRLSLLLSFVALFPSYVAPRTQIPPTAKFVFVACHSRWTPSNYLPRER